MDLALELGFRTVEALRREMTEEELGQWYRYASRKKLPMRRIELLLANLARLTAGSDAIAPFVFDESLREALTPKPVSTVEDGVLAINAITGNRKVIRLGEKRRKRA
jgi:hypothetical protein